MRSQVENVNYITVIHRDKGHIEIHAELKNSESPIYVDDNPDAGIPFLIMGKFFCFYFFSNKKIRYAFQYKKMWVLSSVQFKKITNKQILF